MTQQVYRGNLSAKSFPFLTDFQGQTVIMQGNDNTFSRYLTSAVADKDLGMPVVFYMHNCIPGSYGFQSVGYDLEIPPLSPTQLATQFTSAIVLFSNVLGTSTNGPLFYFAPKSDGTHYTYVLGTAVWQAISNSVPYTPGLEISYATVQGISYIFFPGIGCYKWDSVLNQLISVTLTALTISGILGITAYQGYMVAYNEDSVYWSSTLDIDPTTNSVDFTPSLVTGAGNINPEGARGPITCVLPSTFGMAVYTTDNIVSAVYSGNSRYPFNFKQVVSSGGLSSQNLVAYNANTGNHYAYTTAGFQEVTATNTTTCFPDMTDFLAGGTLEDFDESTMTFTQTQLTLPMVKRIAGIAERYFVVSYGISSLTHAIIYDMTQERFGKVKIDHVCCFEYQYLKPSLSDAPRKSIAFLQADGTVYILNPEVNNPDSAGVFIWGKFQYVRSRLTTMEEVRIQQVGTQQSATLWNFYTTTSGTLQSCSAEQLYDATPDDETVKVFKTHRSAKSHTFCLVGGFNINSYELVFHNHGRR